MSTIFALEHKSHNNHSACESFRMICGSVRQLGEAVGCSSSDYDEGWQMSDEGFLVRSSSDCLFMRDIIACLELVAHENQ